MAVQRREPTSDAMREVLRRVSQDLDEDGLRGNEMLQIEMTLGGMLPYLETRLQVTVEDNQEAATVDRAV